MNYFLAYLIMQVSTFKGWATFLSIVALILTVATWITWLCICDHDRDGDVKLTERSKKMGKKYLRFTVLFLSIFLIIVMLNSLVPNTKTIFKVIALKNGYDIVTSDKVISLAEKGGDTAEALLDLCISEFQEEIRENLGIKKEGCCKNNQTQ
jgi:hypothetical protein